MTLRRRAAGLLSLAVLGWVGFQVARFALPMDRVPFDKWLTGLGPRLWTTWWFLGTFVLGVLSFGQLLVRSASKRGAQQTPRDGSWALSFASGAISFAVAIGLFGWMGWLSFPFFWVLPLVMALAGLPSLRDAVVETRAQWARAPPFSIVEMAALLFGGFCLGLLVLQVIAPDNANFDAMWYHLRGPERNALAGAIERTPEGDVLLSLPSATNWLYTWAFLAPANLDDKVVLALHLELSLFVGTLACIPPLVRALVPGHPRSASRVSWVALFFFPSIFVYDTGLMGGSDHAVALWAAAVLLAWVQTRERDDLPSWALLGLLVAGLSAKYSSIYLLVPLIPAMAIDSVWRGHASDKAIPQRLAGLFLAGAVTVVVTAPYWLRNWVWYHNPVYPALASLFPTAPWNQDALAWQANAASSLDLSQHGSAAWRIEATVHALYDYQQKLYGWKDMMGDQPVMGSGYLLSLVVLPFLSERRRLFALAVLLNVGIAVWFNSYQHHMRYLIVLTPLMAAGMAATALSMWQAGWPSRAGVLGVVGLLLSAYGDVPFRQTHRIFRHSSPVENAADFIAKRGPRGSRLKMWEEIGASLPPQARPLLHGVETHLGLPRRSVTDYVWLQFGINYGRLGSVPAVWRHLRQLGVTHLIWANAVEQPDSISGEALYQALAATTHSRPMHSVNVGELPAEAPPDPGSLILFVGCSPRLTNGLYTVATLAEPLPPRNQPWPKLAPVEAVTGDWQTLATDPRVGWVVHEEWCKLPAPTSGYLTAGQHAFEQSNKLQFYVRQR